MASFGLFTDSSLTTAYSGISALVHQSDLSDGDQDFVLYLGSPLTGRTLSANSNPGVDNITLTPTDTLPDWTASTAAALGDILEPTVDNTYMYICVQAGDTDASEPTWPTTVGSQVTDGTAIWECYAKAHLITEIKLATTSAGLDSATAGAALSLGTTINSESANAVQVHVRITNAVATTCNTAGFANISVVANSLLEEAA